MTSLRAALLSLLAFTAAVPCARAEETDRARRAAPEHPSRREIDRNLLLLDADDVEIRERAEKALRDLGPGALGPLRDAASHTKLEAEGRSRADRIILDLEFQAEQVRLWGEKPDPVAEVRARLVKNETDALNWEFHLLNDPALVRGIPRCRFVIADWIGIQDKSVPTILFAVCREPAAVVEIRYIDDATQIAAYLPPAPDARSKSVLAGLLAGLEATRSETEGAFTFEAMEAVVPVAQDGATRIADAGNWCFTFDKEGRLEKVDRLDALQRGR